MEPNILPNGLMIGTQLPLDRKLWVKTKNELIELGPSFNKAYIYYQGLKIYCLEDKKNYIWDDVNDPFYEGKVGLIEGGFTYPDNMPIAANIDYSNKTFNFFEDTSGSIQVFEEDILVSLDNKNIGKYSNGETIPCKGWTFEEWARDVSIEYLTPSFTSFLMQSQSSLVEVGTVISGNKNFGFVFQYPENVLDYSVKITDVTSGSVLAEDLPKTSPQLVNVGSITKTGVSSNQWKAAATDTKENNFESSLYTITWNFRYFAGNVPNLPTTGNDVRVSLLSSSIISNGNSMTFNTGTTNRRFVIAIPSHKTLVEAKNMGTNENLPFILSEDITTVPDASNTSRNYKIYILENAVPFGSDYIINITLS